MYIRIRVYKHTHTYDRASCARLVLHVEGHAPGALRSLGSGCGPRQGSGHSAVTTTNTTTTNNTNDNSNQHHTNNDNVNNNKHINIK